jgi:hypothetical protein
MNFSSAKGGEAFRKEKWLFQQAICLFFSDNIERFSWGFFLKLFYANVSCRVMCCKNKHLRGPPWAQVYFEKDPLPELYLTATKCGSSLVDQ